MKENSIEEIYLTKGISESVNSAHLALLWYLNAKKTDNPWNYRLPKIDLETGELVRSLVARTMGSGNFSLFDCSRT